jgi:RNA polymerase sigma-70 factor (ECF subfamily)
VDVAERAELEARIRAAFDGGDFAAAATEAIRGYGPELFGFLVGLAHDEQVASDAFSAFCSDLWRDLPRFRWESTFRTWAYMLARHQLYRAARERGKRRREVTPSEAPEVAALAIAVRTATLEHLRTETKDAFADLRGKLDPDDQMLLVLRVDKDLEWRDVARVLGGDKDAAALDRDAAAQRKRFERVKARLRALAREAGLME